MAPTLVAESIKKIQKEAETKRVGTYDRNGNFYLGGDSTKEYLWRHEGEEENPWIERKKRFTDCGLTGRIGNALIAALYGQPVIRELDDVNDDANDILAGIFDMNHWDAKQRVIGQNQIVAGDAWASVRWSDRLSSLKLHTVEPANMFAEIDPDDPMRMITAIERMIDSNSVRKFWYWIWNDNSYILIDQDGKPIEHSGGSGWLPNPYGCIPYVHWRGLPFSGSFWGISPVRGVVEIHELYNNRASQFDRIVLYQAHSTLLLKTDNAEETMRHGASNALIVGSTGDATYISPNADLRALIENLDKLWQQGFDVGGIPMSIIRGGQANSGFQLVQEYRTMSEVVEDLRVEAKRAEVEFVTTICRIGRAHGIDLPEDPVVNINFTAQVIPADRQAEFQRDYLQLTGTPQTMTRRRFLERWSDLPAEALDEYMAELDAETAARQPFPSAAVFGLPEGSIL